MQTTATIWQNGKFIPWEDAKVHVLSHALHYGGGAFEGIRFYKTEQGPAVFCLSEHLDRFFYSTRMLKMAMPYTKAELTQTIMELVKRSQLEAGYIRPIAFYGYGKLGVNPRGNPVDLAIACFGWGAYLPHEQIAVKTSRYIRVHPDSTIVDAKLCGHYLNGILASLEIQGTHYHEALFLDSRGYISEGVGENFFMVKEDAIYTPKLGTILAGITRKTIITLAMSLGHRVVETDLTVEDAYQAKEAFFTGTAAEVSPIHSIDDHVLGEGKVGDITAAIKQAYLDVVHGRNATFADCLTVL